MFIVFVISLCMFAVLYVVVCMYAPLAGKSGLSNCLDVINNQSNACSVWQVMMLRYHHRKVTKLNYEIVLKPIMNMCIYTLCV